MISVVYRPETPLALKCIKELTLWATQKKISLGLAPGQKKVLNLKVLSSKDFSNSDLIVVLGGDGTYLRAIRLLEGKSLPILGFNLGSLGFLTPFQAEELLPTVELYLKKKLSMERRSLIELEQTRNGKVVLSSVALNDVVLERGSLSQLINISVFCNRQPVSEIKADGLIISGPTGSTAYNLAAGGPILHPQVSALMITPVAPHSLNSRPVIFSDDQSLTFKMVPSSNIHHNRAHIVIDGQTRGEFKDGDEIRIWKHKHPHLMMRPKDLEFFKLLKEKLRLGDRGGR